MKIKILISILLCIGLMLCFIACSGEDTGAGGNNPTESSAPSQNGGGESKPSDSTDESKPSEDVYKKEYHTVAFVTNNGTTIEPVQVEDGRKLAEPDEITRLGYTFDGWYLGKEKWSFVGYVVTEDITLAAKWIANENAVSFDSNGGVGTMEGFKMVTDSVACLPNNTYTRAGYHFVGWSTTQGGEVEYTDGAEYTMGTNSSYTLYAVWEANSNTVVFDANGATSGEMDLLTVKSDESARLPINLFFRRGYIFKGWATAFGGGVEYTDGAEYVMGTDSSYTLYAVWEAKENTLVLKGNGATGEMADVTIKSDETVKLPINTYTIDGYHFAGWSKSSYGKVEYADGGDYTMGTDSSYTLYAVWEANENTLVFDGNGATGGIMENMTIKSDFKANLTVNAFVRAGYHFVGWSTTQGGEVEYTDGAQYKMGTEASYTLYAIWEANDNNIVFNPNGATSGSTAGISAKTDERVTLTKNGFIRDGYTFTGWATTSYGIVKYVDGDEYTMGTDSSYTLYAVWQANENTLVFDGSGAGGEMADVKIKTDVTVTLPKVTYKRAGYTFKGWSTTKSGNVEYTNGASYTMGTEASYTLYAVWEINVNGLTFNANGGSGNMTSLAVNSFEKVTLPKNNFARKGYTFVGWSTISGGDVKYTDGAEYTMGTNSSYTLYAVWEIDVYTITYEKNGGTGDLKETFTVNDLPLTLKDLNNKTNYLFNYWYKESDFSGKPVFEITEIGNVTLYAEYVECTDGLVLEEGNGAYTVTGYTGTATEVVIPRSYKGKKITSIGRSAFYGCDSLTSITIPDGVTSIGDSAFYYCSSLTSVTIPEGVTSIGGGAFLGCTSLTSITIPDSVTSIGDHAFDHCTSLTSITIPEGVTSIGNYAFYYCTSLTSVTIGNGVTSIGYGAFAWCTSLTSITIGDSVTSIGERAFYYCDSLTSITIPDSATIIGNYAFENCTSLTSITIPKGVTSIGDSAFSGCTSLTSVTIGNGVTSIGERAFYNCTSLTIYCETTSKPSGWDSYWNYSNCPVVWSCNNNEVADDGCIYTIIDGIRYALKDGEATVVRQPSNITIAYIPASITYKGQVFAVTSIGMHAFSLCTSLTSIEIPNSVTSIGSLAFWNCTSLTSIEIPNSVTSISSFAFYNCASLTSITIPKGVTSIGSYAFETCRNLTSVTIPNSVTSIGSYAFSDCESLTSITIPNSVTSIGERAFYECTSLTIYCEATSKPSGWSSSWNSNRPVVWGKAINQ